MSGSPENSPNMSNAEPMGYNRLSKARRRASHIQHRVTVTASQVWARAIARAHGSVSFSASMRDAAIILPNVNPPIPRSARNSIPDITLFSQSDKNGISLKPSSKSLRLEMGSERRPHSFASVNSLSALLRVSTPRYALPSPEAGYEKLLLVEGESRAVFSLGFGPQKGLLGEDTLRTSVEVSRLSTGVGASDKLQELAKKHSEVRQDRQPSSSARDNWGPRSLPRVSIINIDRVNPLTRLDPVTSFRISFSLCLTFHSLSLPANDKFPACLCQLVYHRSHRGDSDR